MLGIKHNGKPVLSGLFALALLIGATFAMPVHSADTFAAIPAPKGDIVLTISGKIENRNVDGRVDLDMDTLMSYPKKRIRTTTMWTEGINTFEGIAVETLMNITHATGTIGEFSALNDYTVRINLNDPIKHGAVIAYLHNGQRMSVREKGPLWLIYPIDSNPDLQDPIYRDRMIWQLRSIEVK